MVNSLNIPVLYVLLLLWDRFTQDRSGAASLSPAVYTVPSAPPLLLLCGAQEVQSTSLWEDRVYFHLELCCGVESDIYVGHVLGLSITPRSRKKSKIIYLFINL